MKSSQNLYQMETNLYHDLKGTDVSYLLWNALNVRCIVGCIEGWIEMGQSKVLQS